MSLKKNIITSYISQAYVIIVGILVFPLYISEMGAEAYGLVGFFSMLQVVFNLMDLGLSATISRETARNRAGVHSNILYLQLYRALNILFIIIALSGGLILFFLSRYIAVKWLNIENISFIDVTYAIQVMALTIPFRWMTGLYRGVVIGNEKIVWLSVFNVLIATLRFLFVLPVMWLWGSTPMVFFSYQFIVALLEYAGLFYKSNHLLPYLNKIQKSKIGWSIRPIKNHLKFALSIAMTSGIWVFVTQTDKIIMSKILTLEEYGYFTLSVLVASGILMISAPISKSILPRLSKLSAEKKEEEFFRVYRKATQLVTIIAGSASILIVVLAKPILWVWTGDEKIVEICSPILQLYAAGYGVLAVSAFPYYLQYAIGKLSLHIIGSILYVSTLIPLLLYATQTYGMIGAGYAWLIVNLLYMMIWTGIVHNNYAKGIHLKWLSNDILKLIILPTLFTVAISQTISIDDRLNLLIELIIILCAVITITILPSNYMNDILEKLKASNVKIKR